MRRLLLVALLAFVPVACEPPPNPPNSAGPYADIWLAGDSIAAWAYPEMATADRVYNVTRPGYGFTEGARGSIQSTVYERVASLTHIPRWLIVQGGTNDEASPVSAMAEFEANMNSLGTQVIWLTTPVGPTFAARLAVSNAWIRTRPRFIDCDTVCVRAAGMADGFHPTPEGYRRYAACIDQGVPK